jgi:glycosyltransferase involved in cell wall biosynthesis
VAGEAALLVDPTDTTAIGDGLERVLSDSSVRERLVAAGRERAAAFSWEAAAEGLIAAYRRLLGEEATTSS